MTRRRFLRGALMSGTYLLPGVGLACAIEIVPRVDPESSAEISVRSIHNFEQEITLKLRTDPSRVSPKRLAELVRKIDMRDGQGVVIQSGIDIDTVHDLVLGFSGGTAEIVKVTTAGRDLQVIGLFKDAQGQLIQPPASQIGAYTTGGERLCFAYQTIEMAAAPMTFALWIDRSGSMKDVMGAVKETARHFIHLLPNHARCSVGSFNDRWSLVTRGPYPCRVPAGEL